MKLIIDIDKETYNDIQSRDWKNGKLVFSEEWIAIHNGTPFDGVLQEIRQEIDKYYQGVNKLDDMLDFEKGLSLAYDTALAIIDKHIREIEEC